MRLLECPHVTLGSFHRCGRELLSESRWWHWWAMVLRRRRERWFWPTRNVGILRHPVVWKQRWIGELQVLASMGDQHNFQAELLGMPNHFCFVETEKELWLLHNIVEKKVEVSLRLFDIFKRNMVFIFLCESLGTHPADYGQRWKL